MILWLVQVLRIIYKRDVYPRHRSLEGLQANPIENPSSHLTLLSVFTLLTPPPTSLQFIFLTFRDKFMNLSFWITSALLNYFFKMHCSKCRHSSHLGNELILPSLIPHYWHCACRITFIFKKGEPQVNMDLTFFINFLNWAQESSWRRFICFLLSSKLAKIGNSSGLSEIVEEPTFAKLSAFSLSRISRYPVTQKRLTAFFWANSLCLWWIL